MPYEYDPDDKFGYKDKLPTDHPEKVVRGVEFDDEFKKIENAINPLEDATSGDGQFIDAPKNGQVYGRQDGDWTAIPDFSSYITDAPSDGEQYARQDGAWAVVDSSGAGMVISDTEPVLKTTGMQWLEAGTANIWIWDEDKWLQFPDGGEGAGVTARVIGDPTSVGWELDPATGRYTWTTDTIGEAPNDGLLYGRQSESWAEVAPSAHNHAIANVTGLQDALDGKADVTHTHEIADINGLQDALDNAGGTDSPWVLEENDSGKFVHLADENLSGTYPVVFDIADGSGAWNSLSITQIDGVYLYGEYAWANDMESETLEIGPTVRRSVVKKEEKRLLKNSTRELDWEEVPLVVHGKIQANDVVDANGDSIIGGGGGGNDSRITDTQISNWDTAYGWGNHATAGYLKTHQSLAGYATQSWVSSNYQVRGSYLTSESDPTVPSWVKSITQANINSWNAAASGGGGDPFPWTGSQAVFNGTGSVSTIKVSAGGGRGPEIEWYNTAGRSKYLRLNSNSNLELVSNGYAAVVVTFTDSGLVQASDFNATSDANLKKNITTAPQGIIYQLKGREWEWKESGKKGSGVVAQELEAAGLDHLVNEDGNGNKTVAYNGLVAYLIEEVKALRDEIEALKQ